jgi:hypothetical protein
LSSPGTRDCKYCTFSMPISADRCPHCARPSLFPNVEMASDSAELAALEARYAAARTRAAASGTASITAEFERETGMRSRVAISRDSSEVYRLACGDDQLYTTFYRLTQAGVRLPTDSKWDSDRLSADNKLFPYYHGEVRSGALTLDNAGLLHYGDCHLIMKTTMVDFRTTVFTENTAAFAAKNSVIPPGHRATWENRGRLAVAKLAPTLTPLTTTADLPAILKKDRTSTSDDSFVEAHLYGSMSIRTVEQVGISLARKPAVRLKALREKLNKLGIPLVNV